MFKKEGKVKKPQDLIYSTKKKLRKKRKTKKNGD